MTPRTPPRIQGLDRLRALSIALVLVAHVARTRGVRLPDSMMAALDRLQLGPLGVRVIFVNSGFLIATLLLNEFRKTGGVPLQCTLVVSSSP